MIQAANSGVTAVRPLIHRVPESSVEESVCATADGVQLALTRFQRGRSSRAPVVLLHGLTGASDMFVMPEHRNLVSVLLDAGWSDVWCVDWRGSCRLPYNHQRPNYSIDDVAVYDLPTVFEKIRSATQKAPMVIAHCVGALALGMSMAAGLAGELAGIVANAVFLTPTFPPITLAKTLALMDFVQSGLRLDYVPVDIAAVNPASRIGAMMLWASLTHRSCTNPTCQFLSFVWGHGDPTLFLHENLHPATHDRLQQLLGPVPVQPMLHLRKMALAREAVPWDDAITAASLTARPLTTIGRSCSPILLLRGQQNNTWGNSLSLCHEALAVRHPHLDHEYIEIPRYGHQDVFIGRSAAIDVFPQILGWMDSKA